MQAFIRLYPCIRAKINYQSYTCFAHSGKERSEIGSKPTNIRMRLIEELTWTLVTFPKMKVLEKRLLSSEPIGVVVELDRAIIT